MEFKLVPIILSLVGASTSYPLPSSHAMEVELVVRLLGRQVKHHSMIVVEPKDVDSDDPRSLGHRLCERLMSEQPTILARNDDYLPVAWVSKRHQRQVLKIYFVDVTNEVGSRNATESLYVALDYLERASRGRPRAKCLVVVTRYPNENHLENDYRPFFEYAWTKKFLYLTVIEVVRSFSLEQPLGFLLDDYRIESVLVHQYNPFFEDYIKENYSDEIELFKDKLQDLNGYRLKSAFLEEIPMATIDETYEGDDVWRAVSGQDFDICKLIALKLNFSMVMGALNYENKLFKRFGERTHVKDIFQGLLNDSLDFSINLGHVLATNNLDNLQVELGMAMYPNMLGLLVKQYGSGQVFSNRLGALIFVYLCVALVTVKLLRRRAHVIDWLNVLKTMLGQAHVRDARQTSERLIFLCLVLFYALFSQSTSNALLNAYRFKVAFPPMRDLDDFVRANISPRITKFTLGAMRNLNSSQLNLIASRSSSLANYPDLENCVDDLLDRNKRVNACESLSFVGRIIVEELESLEPKITSRSLKLVSPLIWSWESLAFSPVSPYIRKFNGVVHRIIDSGIARFMYFRSKNNYLLKIKEKFQRVAPEQSKAEFYLLERRLSRGIKLMMWIYVVCLGLAVLVFLLEMLGNFARVHTFYKRIPRNLRV
ncbi:hypothetical protein TKK_0000449 [Trichogramma kaykai]